MAGLGASVSAVIASMGSISYYMPSARMPVLLESRRLMFGKALDFDDELIPVSLLVIPTGSDVSATNLSSIVADYLRKDDVFSAMFLEHIYLLAIDQTRPLTFKDSTPSVLATWGTQSMYEIKPIPSEDFKFRGGPYFASSKGLRQAWRLYEDTNSAFMFPVVPVDKSSGAFAIPPTSLVPVPSRLFYEKPSLTKPLSGMRVAIKDNIDLKGVRTSAGNRAFQELYPPRDHSATCVEQLLAAGAVIVGKTKSVQFASGEMARDWIDYQASFSPRGDGYLDPSCSSTGSATAMSSYDWMDMTLGTDTFGSVAGPAGDHGLFGLRPSLDAISTKGIVPVSSVIDAVGFFTRSMQMATAVAKTLVAPEGVTNSCSSTVELLYPTDIFAVTPPGYQQYIEAFILKLETFLKVKRSDVDVGALFREQSVGGEKSMQEYLHTTIPHIQLFDCYRNLLPFRQQYKQKFGKSAYADPYIRFKWWLGEKITKEEYDQAVRERNVFAEWLQGQLLPKPAPGFSLNKILLLPNGRYTPYYRDEYDGKTLEEGAGGKQGFGFKAQGISVLGGLPFFNIPIGQFPYMSRVTKRQEFLPAAIAVVGPKGSDVEMLELIEGFLQQTLGQHSSVQTGRTSFPVED